MDYRGNLTEISASGRVDEESTEDVRLPDYIVSGWLRCNRRILVSRITCKIAQHEDVYVGNILFVLVVTTTCLPGSNPGPSSLSLPYALRRAGLRTCPQSLSHLPVSVQAPVSQPNAPGSATHHEQTSFPMILRTSQTWLVQVACAHGLDSI